MKKETSPSPIVDLGLSSLAGDEPHAVRPVIDAPNVLAAFDWIDSQRERRMLPTALIAERAVSVIAGVSPALRSEQLQVRIDRLITALDSPEQQLSEELVARLHSACRGELEVSAPQVSTELPASNTPPDFPPRAASTQSIDANAPVEKEPPSDWSRFAEKLSALQKGREGEVNGSGRGPVLPAYKETRRPVWTMPALGLFLALIFFLSVRAKQAPELGDQFRFARLRAEPKLAPTTADDLMIPRMEPLINVSSLSSLAYEISIQTPAARTSQSNAARVIPVRQPVLPDFPQPQVAAPVAVDPPQKESLNIGTSTEPAALREIQIEPEAPQQENTFEFPPFINKPKEKPETSRSAGGTYGGFGGEVRRFNPARRFSITAATQVMSRPSYWAPRVGGLDPGDSVLVDARMGNWFRIVGEMGGPAYILAQDAVPE